LAGKAQVQARFKTRFKPAVQARFKQGSSKVQARFKQGSSKVQGGIMIRLCQRSKRFAAAYDFIGIVPSALQTRCVNY
jgi:hypothetical protein